MKKYPPCRICSSHSISEIITPREMMFGTELEFEYIQCGNCQALNIVKIPENLAEFYPDDYYSLNWSPPEVRRSRFTFVKQFLRRQRSQYLRGIPNPLGFLLAKFSHTPEFYNWIRPLKLSLNTRILSVGDGHGSTLHSMGFEGFTNLTGLDPYNKDEVSYPEFGIKIYNHTLEQHIGKYDVILMSHVLEHFTDPHRELSQIRRLLAPGGTLIIRTPLCDSWAFDYYKQHWVQIDAPRHITVHSNRSMHILAESMGMIIVNKVYDSLGFQFWASEHYIHSIPLQACNIYAGDKSLIFDNKDLKLFEKLAKQLNKQKRGDQAIFYLKIQY